ncbi:hypothetical protein [Pararhizobium sp. PWRC1-1]|uniref:hypothetical protein n=1 Tax=Pararhizobium sp. PWRC1-1 TaxID=2804566 RepID=UPI003CEA455A
MGSRRRIEAWYLLLGCNAPNAAKSTGLHLLHRCHSKKIETLSNDPCHQPAGDTPCCGLGSFQDWAIRVETAECVRHSICLISDLEWFELSRWHRKVNLPVIDLCDPSA